VRGAGVEVSELAGDADVPDYAPEPFGPAAIWREFDPARYGFLEGAEML